MSNTTKGKAVGTRKQVSSDKEERRSSEIVRSANHDAVLEIIRARQPLARVDIARLSGLQRSTISSIIEQLIGEGWIKEGAIVKTARGRRPTLISMSEDMALLVGDIRPTRAILAAVDLNGRFLSREVVPLIPDAVKGTQAIAVALDRIRKQHVGKTFEGVGLSLPGRVDESTQRLLLAPNLKWKDFDIKKSLEAHLSLTVEMDNAANACLLSELWFGRLAGVKNAVLITISEGIGAAVFANGQLVSGMSGLAGEFGHLPIDPSGPRCGCGLNGCWEMFGSSRAAMRYYRELKPNSDDATLEDLLNLAGAAEPEALQALARQAKCIGEGLRLITAALSPERILFAGDITAYWDHVEPIMRCELEKRLLAGRAPALVPIGDGEMARLRGAAALVLQRHSKYHSRSGQAAK